MVAGGAPLRPGDYYAVDLDGTLAYDGGYAGPDHIGDPIPEMLAQVIAWRNAGIAVKIFTARVSTDGTPVREELARLERQSIERWCRTHLGEILPITCEKTWRCAAIYDDRAWRVERNTGRILEAPKEIA
jgi:hypothetical protein